MADDKPDLAWRVVGGLVGLGTAWAAKKVLGFAWKKVTGKDAPGEDDDEVGLGEAIGYAVVMGVGMQVAQIVVNRTARRRYDSWRALRQVPPKP